MYPLDRYYTLFNQYLSENAFNQQPQELYAPVNYILSLGGKRLRPLLVLMGSHLFNKYIEKALPAAMSVEVFHNFTLLHDDIMDAAPLRRGKPTVHIRYNVNTGILSGDVMMIYAYDFLVKNYPPQLASRLLTIFTKMAIEVCEGQQYDMNFEHRNNVTIPEYLKMIELKTSVLIAAAFQMGALIGGATPLVAEQLYAFGLNIGIAFQIQDDILDTYGDPEKFGKKVGGDIVQNKKTYLVLKTLELANATQRTDLQRLMRDNNLNENEKIAAVKNIFDAVGVQQKAEQLMNDFQSKAFESLEITPLSFKKKNYLKSWANTLLQRQF